MILNSFGLSINLPLFLPSRTQGPSFLKALYNRHAVKRPIGLPFRISRPLNSMASWLSLGFKG